MEVYVVLRSNKILHLFDWLGYYMQYNYLSRVTFFIFIFISATMFIIFAITPSSDLTQYIYA